MENLQTSNLPFHVLVKPIGPTCNLRCSYCFYLKKQEIYPFGEQWRMTEGVLEEFTRQYIVGQPKDTTEVNFAWQGGEPTLLEVDFYRRAVQLQREHARPGMRVTNSLQTNGTLLDDDWGRFLREEGFLVGLSVDGPSERHNRYRLDRRGQGSFDAVMNGLEVLKRHGVAFNALTAVQRDNADHPEQVYDFLVDGGFGFIQFIPIVVWLPDGAVSPDSVEPAQFGRFLNGVFDRWLQREHVGRVFVQLFDVTLGLVMGHPAALCVHGKTCGRAVVLEHNGDVYGCDHWVLPTHRLGNILAKPLAEMVDGEQQTAFGRAKFDGLPTCCRGCEFLCHCHGACPKDRMPRTPATTGGLQYLCEGYRQFYRHSLEVFGRMAQCLRTGRPAKDYRSIHDPPTPAARHGPAGRTGRNDPCPCGSGLKFKKCCGRPGDYPTNRSPIPPK